MNPMIALGQRMLYISCTSSIPPIWSEIYLRLSPARSLDYYFFVTPVTFHKSRTCKTDTPVYPFPVLTNPHELSWPPSTLDGWECCLLSMLPFKQNHCGLFFIQIAICYLRYYTRQFFPTTVVVSAALVAFALQQLNNNSLDQNTAWSACSVIEECSAL